VIVPTLVGRIVKAPTDAYVENATQKLPNKSSQALVFLWQAVVIQAKFPKDSNGKIASLRFQ
jgi:hypothetical protein